jgi:hypothetical protein
MLEALKVIGLFWVGLAVTYGIVAVGLLAGRYAVRQLKTLRKPN